MPVLLFLSLYPDSYSAIKGKYKIWNNLASFKEQSRLFLVFPSDSCQTVYKHSSKSHYQNEEKNPGIDSQRPIFPNYASEMKAAVGATLQGSTRLPATQRVSYMLEAQVMVIHVTKTHVYSLNHVFVNILHVNDIFQIFICVIRGHFCLLTYLLYDRFHEGKCHYETPTRK